MRNVVVNRNYHVADIPDTLSPKDYDIHQRRADILQRIIDVGHPYGIKQSVLAERYGVSQSQISLDMKEIQLFLKDTLGDYAVSLTQIAFEKIYNKNMQSENYEVAWKVLMDWNKWLENRGALNQEPKTIKVEHRLKDMSKDELLEMLDGIIEEDED